MSRVTVTGEREIIVAIDRQIAKTEAIIKRIIIELFSRVVKKTPVDTGRARANWIVSTGSASEETNETEDKSGANAIGSIVSLVLRSDVKQTTSYYLSNNLPYIQALEDGSSQQAPSGMVKTTIREFDSLVDQGNREI